MNDKVKELFSRKGAKNAKKILDYCLLFILNQRMI
jgi:hypothetical protein